MAALRVAAVVLALLCLQDVSASVSERVAGKAQVNPIRRVVTMLQSMQKKVAAEGEKEQVLFDKFMCYCKNGKGALDASIASASNTNEQLTASIKENEAALIQLKADLKAAQGDRADAKAAVASASALRSKESSAYVQESSELKTNLAAMKKATSAIESGMGGAFLQTSAASVLKQLSVTMDISSMDREMITSFLMQGQGQADAAGYVPASGQITGILKQMTDTMAASLATATAEEETAVKDFNALVSAKTKEINALTKQVESKTSRIGELGVEIVTQKEDLDDSTKSLLEDEAFLKDMAKNCEAKSAEWATRQKVRAEELLAIADTIKLLNDDDALELFKKTLPASFMQLQTNGQAMKRRAVAALQQASQGDKRDYRLDLISLALKGKKVSFDKVLKMVDNMVVLLKQEQVDDDNKKEYCENLIDKTEDDLKVLELSVSDLGKAIADYQERIATLVEEVSGLADGIKALDKQVAEATEERKNEHEENTETLASDNAAKELIGMAKNRMNKFYSPKLYKAPPAPEAAFAQRSGVAPPPPPETFGAYAKKGGESGGVIAMMDVMVADLDKEITEIEVEEKENQAEYEQLMKDSAEKRANDSKSIEDKESAKADLEATLVASKEEKTSKMKEAMATAKFLSETHGDCDWLLTNHDMRKQARAGEVDALTKAKAVLSGADYSLLQSARVHRHA